ncbi:MAG: hypothetical protein IKU57_04395, partial [Oscillospiraceae bacterium]|nr:hypothetical protein [Oscillospiraceae bacterium]
GERVAGVGEGRRRTVAKDIRRAPQQGVGSSSYKLAIYLPPQTFSVGTRSAHCRQKRIIRYMYA